MPQRKSRQEQISTRGFSLVELGVAIGCIAILMLVVFQAKGFLDNSRLQTTIGAVKTIHRGALAWSERVNSGRNYQGIVLGSLCNYPTYDDPIVEPLDKGPGVTDCGFRTGWDGSFVLTTPTPVSLEINFCVSTTAMAADTHRLLQNTCTMTIVGGACPDCGAGCRMSCLVH